MKVVWKYGTGHEIPSDAKYLCTQVETEEFESARWVAEEGPAGAKYTRNALVWHYYEIENPPIKEKSPVERGWKNAY